ncbi:RDD family protein [Piscinibacter koreensis]|uniref:RDD family protein n=1 Tax=Piscinibacter koreensis TaxID=2742824 RepID=A0A7Y6NLJ8_9BURK|nr:RDD family protein [Schlegelella koreensis]NUZ05423.1 RDD family protein [Schlegelella koreensis]
MTLLDTRYVAETPEGIGLSLRPAGVMPRLYAFVIDFGIRLVLFAPLARLLATLGEFGWGLALLLYFAIDWFYAVLFELLPGAATPGKRAVGLRVVMDSGLPITPAASLTRNLLRAADFLPFFYAAGALSMLLRPDFKRLGDLAAGTLVVHRHVVSLHGAPPAAAPLAPAADLAPRAQAAIVAWAGRVPRLTPARADELAELASAALPAGARRDPGKELLGVAHWLIGER